MKKLFVLLVFALGASLFLASSKVVVVSQSAAGMAGEIETDDGTLIRWTGVDGALANNSATAQAALTAAEKQEILTAHNNARKSVPGNTGGPLPALTWDNTLAAAAQKWANTLAGKCNGSQDHSPTNYGENHFSAWSSDMTAPPTTATKAISYWVGEKQHYTYSKTKCAANSVCGTCSKLPCVHYTQIVWRTTTKVGCARATCKAPGKNWTIWVCNYNPAGNVGGQPPY